MPTKTVTRTVKLYIDDKEIDNSVKSIRAEVKLLTSEMNKMTIGSDEYNAKMRKIAQLNSILDKHKSDLKSVGAELDKNNGRLKDQGSIFSSLSSNFSKYATMFTGFLASITAAMMLLNKNREDMKDKDSAAANLKALTGLDDKSIEWLTKQAEILSTTMDKSGLRIKASSKEILDAYTLVGSAKPELLGDKEALNKVTIEALRMATASKMEVKDAVTGLTLALNQYGASADDAAKYVNVLAAGAKYGSAEIASQTVSITKAGVAASTAKIPIEGLVGSIQTLAEKGIKDEVAGTGMKTFFLKLESGAKDTRPSVVGLSTALQRLKAENLDASKMVDMFGLETYTVAQALIANADKVDYYTKAVTGTNTATEQAAINSNTLEAKEAQVKNKMTEVGITLATMLNPAYMETLNIFQKLITAVPIVVGWIIKNKNVLITLTAGIIAYNVIIKASIVLSKLKVSWLAIEDTVMALQILRYSVLNGTMTTTIALQKALNLVMKLNPIGIVVAAITALIAAFVGWEDQMADTDRYARELNKTIAEEKKINEDTKSSIERLLPVAQDATKSTAERQKAIDELKKVMPGYFDKLDIETSKQYKVADAVSAANRQYKKKLVMIQREAEAEYNKAKANYVANHPGGQQVVIPGAIGTQWAEQSERSRLYALEVAAKSAKKAVDDLNESEKKINNGNSNGNSGSSQASTKNKSYWNQTLSDLTAQYEALSSAELKSKKGLALAKRIAEIQKEIKKYDLSGSSKSQAESAAKKEIQKQLDEIDAEYTFKKNNLTKAYNESSIMSQQEYQNELEKIELDALDKKLTIAGLEPKKKDEISQQILQAQTKLSEKIKEMMKIDQFNQEDNLQAELDANKRKYEKDLELLDYYYKGKNDKQKEYEDAKAKIAADYDKEDQKSRQKDADAKYELAQKGYSDITIALRKERLKENLTDAQYDKKSKNARLKFLKDQLKNEKLSAEKRQEINSEANDIEIQEQEDANTKKQDLQNQYNQILQDSIISMGQLIGEQIGNLIKDGTMNFKDFLRNILNLVIDAVEKAIIATRAASLARNLSTMGFAGLAAYGMETALITSAFELAKAAVANFYDGGFTPSGEWNQPQGIVHSNEFVANRFATSNQSLLPVLNLIDAAQKTGSVANLSSSDIAEVLPYSSRSNSSTVINNNNNNNNVNMLAIAGLLSNVHKSLNLINKRFSNPIIAETYATGKHGTIEATGLVNKMIKNASR